MYTQINNFAFGRLNRQSNVCVDNRIYLNYITSCALTIYRLQIDIKCMPNTCTISAVERGTLLCLTPGATPSTLKYTYAILVELYARISATVPKATLTTGNSRTVSTLTSSRKHSTLMFGSKENLLCQLSTTISILATYSSAFE